VRVLGGCNTECSFIGYSPDVPFDRQLIEAKLALNLIASGDMPSIALDALEADLGGAAMGSA
jgi:hypothetical protein